MKQIRDISKLPRATVGAFIQFAIEDQSTTQTGPQCYANDIPVGFCLPKIFFSNSKAIGIVVDKYRNLVAALQQIFDRNHFPGWDIGYIVDNTFFNIHDGWNAYTNGLGRGIKTAVNDGVNLVHHLLYASF